MAVDQDLLDDIAASVADLYAELESALNQRIAERLRAELDSPYEIGKLDAAQALRRSAQTLLATLQAAREGRVRDAIAAAYRDGFGSALTDLPEGWFPRSGIGQAARAAQREMPNAPAIENLAQALVRDLGRAEVNVLRNVLDAYRSVQAAAAARIISGAFTRRQAAQAAWQRLVDKGVTSFVDSAGRRWKLSSYAEMMTRTNAARAAIQAQRDRLTSIGVDLVIVSDHGQECKLCRPYEGKVLALSGQVGRIEVEHATRDGEMVTVDVVATLDGARAKGLMHPNCRHSTSAYLPGVTKQPKNTADPEGDQARQRQREIERAIRKYKERANAALTPEAKKAAEARVREWQAEMRDHLAAHPDLKRLRYREQPGAGNTPPKGGPASGPVGDLQPPVQPTLDGGPGVQRTPPRAPGPPRPDDAQEIWRREAERLRALREEQDRELERRRAEAERREAEERAKREAAERARLEAEAAERARAEEQARREAEAARRAAEAKRQAEERARKEAEEKAAKEAAERAAREAAERAAREAAEKARREAEEKAAREAAEKARREAQQRAERARRQAPGMKHGVRHRSNEEGLEWARKRLPLPDLTKDERDAVYRYTGDDYELINEGLRGRPPEPGWQRDRYDKVLADLDAAFRKSKTPEPVILHRGVDKRFTDALGVDVNAPESMKSLIGKVLTEDGFLSTSVGENAAFMKTIRLMIRVPKGHQALNVMPVGSFGEQEREILLDRGGRMVVHSVYKRGGAWYVEVELVPKDWVPPQGWKPDPYGDADVGYK